MVLCENDRNGGSEMNVRTDATQAKFSEIVEHVHWGGAKRGVLTDAEWYAVYAEGDGFGYRTVAELREINGGFDWSHVRDSSDEGVERMHARLRSILASRVAA
jgi:hypothetical protein